MPSAVTSPQDTERRELKSLPEGYVVLRRMTYGQFLKRQELAMGMSMSGQDRNDMQMAIAMSQRRVAEFEFSNCIVDHNLEDEEGNPLDFKNTNTLDRLNPKIGNEIGAYIDEMNQFDEGN